MKNDIKQAIFFYRLSTDLSIAKNFADKFSALCMNLNKDLSLWDVSDTTRGYAPGYFSFGLKPPDFPSNGIPGGLFIKGTYGASRSSQPEENTPEYKEWESSGGSKGLADAIEIVKIEVGYIHKITESGKYQRVQDGGEYLVTLDSRERITIDPDQDFSKLKKAMEDVINDVLDDPPSDIELKYWDKSKPSEKSAERYRGHQEKLRLKREERRQKDAPISDPQITKLKTLQERQTEIDKIRAEVYSSIDSFVMGSEDNEYGNADLSFLQRYLPKSEFPNRKSIVDALESYGMNYVSSNDPIASSFTPSKIASKLRFVSNVIDKLEKPSKDFVISNLQSILSSIESKNFIWMSEIGPYTVHAKDREEAVRKILSNLIDGYRTMNYEGHPGRKAPLKLVGRRDKTDESEYLLKSVRDLKDNEILEPSEYSGPVEGEISDFPYKGDISAFGLL